MGFIKEILDVAKFLIILAFKIIRFIFRLIFWWLRETAKFLKYYFKSKKHYDYPKKEEIL